MNLCSRLGMQNSTSSHPGEANAPHSRSLGASPRTLRSHGRLTTLNKKSPLSAESGPPPPHPRRNGSKHDAGELQQYKCRSKQSSVPPDTRLLTTMTTALHRLPAFTNFQDAVKGIQRVSYCTGAIPLDADTSTIFYRTDGKPYYIDFAKASSEDLKVLAESCQPATFGVNKQDVFDETYRKAGKMDAANFATQFHPSACGVVDAIRDAMLPAQDTDRGIKIEMYKLNVYGPGAFFKAHVDTPRSDTMFGSLVVVLPTVHEGGSLVFRHRGTEWTFDTAHAISTTSPPGLRAAFVAFFGDVEHEVAVVTSGYRVTLTYNLYYDDTRTRRQDQAKTAPPLIPVAIPPTPRGSDLEPTLSALLTDPNFLPEGGLVGFGLFYKYAFRVKYIYRIDYITKPTPLSGIEKSLKGSDAAVHDVCKTLQLKTSLKTLYRTNKSAAEFCLADEVLSLHFPAEYGLLGSLKDMYRDAILAYGYGDEAKLEGDIDISEMQPVLWVAEAGEVNSFEPAYIAYGNEPGLDCAYTQLCLIAKVGPFGKRATIK
ncbi:unnamed protein product [Cyclocybe aegerita]|uniref:Fe2OG dioxygenase domain-containing protein n=1 Tax=Cyclocybe aegerita TaxID=1973307 RepID=A0A8S0WUN7_CYCAE|nr:unnamed protein product [Cyclocybe aegerita]